MRVNGMSLFQTDLVRSTFGGSGGGLGGGQRGFLFWIGKVIRSNFYSEPGQSVDRTLL